MPKNHRGLNPKQETFVAQYMIDANATRAAIAAGYSHKSASTQGFDLLRNPRIKAALAEMQGKRLAKLEITADRVLEELAKLAFSNMGDFVRISDDGTPNTDLEGVTREHMAAISEMTVEEFMDGTGEDGRPVRRVKIKLASKREALVDLGKHLNLFDGDAAAAKPVTIIIQGSDKGLL